VQKKAFKHDEVAKVYESRDWVKDLRAFIAGEVAAIDLHSGHNLDAARHFVVSPRTPKEGTTF
jgi:hypothetical protein